MLSESDYLRLFNLNLDVQIGDERLRNLFSIVFEKMQLLFLWK